MHVICLFFFKSSTKGHIIRHIEFGHAISLFVTSGLTFFSFLKIGQAVEVNVIKLERKPNSFDIIYNWSGVSCVGLKFVLPEAVVYPDSD